MIEQPRCWSRRCRHFGGVEEVGGEGEQFQVVVCPAFPRGIPERIAYGEDDHLTYVIGQEGTLVFEEGEQQ